LIELRASTFIDLPPGRIWRWLETLPDHYTAWHPDHIGCRWLRGGSFTPGAEMEFVETLHGKTHRLRARVTGVEQERSIDYRMFPGLKGRFEITKSETGSIFTAVIYVGVTTPVIGNLTDWVLGAFLEGRLEDLAKHQAEEGENLKEILESPVGNAREPT